MPFNTLDDVRRELHGDYSSRVEVYPAPNRDHIRYISEARLNEIVDLHDALGDLDPQRGWTSDANHEKFYEIIEEPYASIPNERLQWIESYDCYMVSYAKKSLKMRVVYVAGKRRLVSITSPETVTDSATTKEKPIMAQTALAEPKKLVALPTVSTLSSELKGSLEAAAWRTASEQATKLIRDSIVARIRAKGDEKVAPLAAFLDSEEGLMAISTFVGYAVLFSPALDGDPRVCRLAASMRTDSAKFVTDAIAEHIMGPITAAFTTVLAGLPAVPADG